MVFENFDGNEDVRHLDFDVVVEVVIDWERGGSVQYLAWMYRLPQRVVIGILDAWMRAAYC